MQKQIISATWNLTRRDLSNPQTVEIDLATITDSQQSALDQLVELQSELQDPTMSKAASDGEKAMRDTLQTLQDSSKSPAERLEQSLATEQQAYQALLRMRARDHEIARAQNRSQSQSSSSSSRQRQQQIESLELNQEENRYETQSQASEPQQEQASAERDAQNRLKELAQRQSDLNEQMQQLEAALQQAKTTRTEGS